MCIQRRAARSGAAWPGTARLGLARQRKARNFNQMERQSGARRSNKSSGAAPTAQVATTTQTGAGALGTARMTANAVEYFGVIPGMKVAS